MSVDLERDKVEAKKRLVYLYLDIIEHYFPDHQGEDSIVDFMEEPLIEAMMMRHNGNQSKSAMHLRISRGTLRKKLEQYFKNRKIIMGDSHKEVILEERVDE